MRARTSSPRVPTEPAQRWQLAWPDTRTLVLALGDAVAFLVFAAAGRGNHGEATGPGAIGQVIWTAVPFALGWFLVAPFVGAYRRALADQPLETLKRTELAWLASWPVALLLRWALAADHQIPASFAVVVLVANAILLGGWRMAFVIVARRLRGQP